jgi:hypothetical protein
LEFKIDFMHARLLHTVPEKRERAKEQLRAYCLAYFALTGRRYVPIIERLKYKEGSY